MRKLVAGSVGVVATVVVLAVSPPSRGFAATSADAPARPVTSETPSSNGAGLRKPAPEKPVVPAAPPAPSADVVAPPKIPPFDVAILATGVRASRVMGKAVRSEAGEDIGTVNDVIINPPDHVAYAIVGVGGFLGVGERLVAIPFDSLEPRDPGAGLILPGATKDSIKLLPEFKYPPRPERPLN